MDQRFTDKPLMTYTITATGNYNGGDAWSESILLRYFHLFKNI